MTTGTRQDSSAGAISLRRAVSNDLTAVDALLVESQLPTEGVAACITDFIVAENDDRIVGAIGIETHGPYALLRSAAVSSAMQGRGVGRALVEALLAETETRGIRSVFLLTTTAENYFPAFGFSRIDRAAVPEELMDSAELQGACPATATVMRRNLR